MGFVEKAMSSQGNATALRALGRLLRDLQEGAQEEAKEEEEEGQGGNERGSAGSRADHPKPPPGKVQYITYSQPRTGCAAGDTSCCAT